MPTKDPLHWRGFLPGDFFSKAFRMTKVLAEVLVIRSPVNFYGDGFYHLGGTRLGELGKRNWLPIVITLSLSFLHLSQTLL